MLTFWNEPFGAVETFTNGHVRFEAFCKYAGRPRRIDYNGSYKFTTQLCGFLFSLRANTHTMWGEIKCYSLHLYNLLGNSAHGTAIAVDKKMYLVY